MPADRLCRSGVIASDHLHAYAGRAALGDGRDSLRARRIDQADDAQQHQRTVDIGVLENRVRGRHGPHRQRQHALTLGGDGVGLFAPPGLVERRGIARRRALLAAHGQNPFRRALDENERMHFVVVIERGHEAMARVEGDDIGARPGQSLRPLIDTGLAGEREQRPLHRVALDRPVAFTPVQRGVAAQRGRAGKFRQQWVRIDIDAVTREHDLPLRRVTHARKREIAGARDHRRHRHLVARQGAGLVGADHRYRTQGLDGGQAAHHGIATRHRVHADRERDGQHSRQPFGNRGHRQPDHHHEHDRKLVVRHESAERQQEGCAHEDKGRQPSGENVHLLDQGRGQGLDAGNEAADAPDFGCRARGDHHSHALAAGDKRAAERHACAIAQRGADIDRPGVLLDRDRFAREDGLLYLETMRPQQAQVGRNLFARLHENDVAGHQVAAVDGVAFPAAQHCRARSEHLPNGLHGLLGLAFLDKADDGIGHHHGQDHQRIGEVTQQQRDPGGCEQHVDQDVVKLHEKADEGAAPGRFRQAVRAVGLEPRLRLKFAQPRRRRRQFGQDRFRFARVPAGMGAAPLTFHFVQVRHSQPAAINAGDVDTIARG